MYLFFLVCPERGRVRPNFVVPRQFSLDYFGEWPENQILIPDWSYFHCPDATLVISSW